MCDRKLFVCLGIRLDKGCKDRSQSIDLWNDVKEAEVQDQRYGENANSEQHVTGF